MKKTKMLIVFIVLSLIAVFGVVQKNRVKTPEKTESIKSNIEYTITHNCVEASTITNVENDKKSLSYFSQCMCFITDGSSEPIGIDIVSATHFESSSKQEAVDLCNNGCQELCEQAVKVFLQEHPDFTIPKRW